MALTQTRLLLIDDEPLVLEMFESVLTKSGFDVSVTSSSRKALELLKITEYDVMVSDVLLEEYDGFDLHAAGRKLYPNIATILITGAPNPIDSERAEVLGIPYLPKPVGFDILLKSIDSSLKAKKGSPARNQLNFA